MVGGLNAGVEGGWGGGWWWSYCGAIAALQQTHSPRDAAVTLTSGLASGRSQAITASAVQLSPAALPNKPSHPGRQGGRQDSAGQGRAGGEQGERAGGLRASV